MHPERPKAIPADAAMTIDCSGGRRGIPASFVAAEMGLRDNTGEIPADSSLV